MTYASTIAADSPYIYLRLDSLTSTTADSGTSGGTATVGAGFTSGAAAGYIDGSSAYIGGTGYVQKNVSAWPTITGHAVEFWYKRDLSYNPGLTLLTNLQDTNWGSFIMGVYINTGTGAISLRGSSTTTGPTVAALADGGWHHFVVSYDKTASTTTIYVDGASKGTMSYSPGTFNAGDPGTVAIGNSSTVPRIYMDEFAYYAKPLTSAQVTAHYNAGATAPVTGVTVAPPVVNVSSTGITAVTPEFVGPTIDRTVAAPVMALGTLSTPSGVTGTATTTNLLPVAGGSGGDWGDTSGNTIEYRLGANGSTGAAYRVEAQFGNLTVPVGKEIVSAMLHLYIDNGSGSGYANGPASPMSVTVSRNAGAITPGQNSTYPATTGTPISASLALPAYGQHGYADVDITPIVKAWAAGSPNYGVHITPSGATNGYVGISTSATDSNKSQIVVALQDIPPVPVTVTAPVMTASLADPAPLVTAQRNASSTTTIVDLGSVDLVAPSASAVFNTPNVSNSVASFGAGISTVDPSAAAYGNATVQAPAVQASLSFLGGASYNPDFVAAATAISTGIATPNAKQFIEYNVLVQAPVTYLGNLENEPVNINLTTNRLTVVPPMSLSLKWPGIYIAAADRYLTKIAKTVDYDDLWYKMDEASGNRAIDSAHGDPWDATTTDWTQSGYYFGNPTFRISDGPELRPAVHFDGIDDYMVVGPYTQDNKYVDADPDNVESGMAVTIEFSIRTTQTDGVVFISGGAGIAGLAAISPSYYSLPHANGNELRLEGGYLTVWLNGAVKVKARQFVSDGQWHHIVMSIPSANAHTPSPSDPIQFDGRVPSYVAVDGQPTLVRYGTAWGGGDRWLPFIVGARTNDAPWDNIANNKTKDVGANALLAMDMRDFIVRLNAYQQLKDTEVIYYEWSNSTVLNPDPMTVSLSTIDPFKVKGNMKKMLALYGLPWGFDDYAMPLYTYASTLSGLAIQHFGDGSEHLPNGSTFNGHSPVYQKVKTFKIGNYLVYPVDLTGGAQNGGYTGGGDTTYATDVTSVPGVIDRSAPFMKENPDGTGYGGFADDSTGLPRFINLQTDLVNVKDFDAITAVNYPWETPNAGPPPRQTPNTYPGLVESYPYPDQLRQPSLGMSVSEWTVARNKLRDSILQAAYDGASLWIGEYHMAQHLGFIGRYDVHDYGHLDGTWDSHALDLDKAHGVDSSGYLGLMGEYIPGAQLMYDRRVTALIPGLTDLPTTELGDHIAGWSYDRWKANGDFTASDLVRRPNGLQIGDQARMCGDGFVGEPSAADVPFVMSGQSYGWFNPSVIALADGTDTFDGRNYLRQNIISAHPDEVVGTPVTREMTGYYGRAGVWVDNPYKDNVLTLAAEVGTVVRGRAIAGRAFIELMEIAITPTMVAETQPLPANQQTKPGVILRYSPSQFNSTWEYDSRRNREVMVTLNNSMLKSIGGGMGFQVVSSSINYMNFTDAPVIYHRRETMHSRGLNWLSQTRQLEAGDVAVYQTAFLLTLTEPNAKMTRTSNPVVQVTSVMRLDAEVRQPRNYLTGDVEVRTLPMEMSIDMRGRGVVNTATAMTLGLSEPGPIVLAAAEMITVFIDSDNGPTTLFLKEDN